MTGNDLKEFFENLIDDSIDDDFAYDLMNMAKDEIEGERDWEFLKKLDATQSRSSGNTYDTAKSLPTDFLSPLKLYVGDDMVPWMQVPFESKVRNKNLSFRYWLDLANSNYYLSGEAQSTGTISFYYIYKTPEIESTTSPVWPDKFHKIIAFKMADLYESGIDTDDLNYRMSDAQRRQFEILTGNMRYWDAKLRARSAENAESEDFDNVSGRINLR